MTSKVTSADGTGIAFTETGTGPALVIVDGAMSYRAFNPTEQAVADALADRYTVYTYDRRGRGESGATDTYTVQAELDDLAALIKHAGGQAIVLGFSSGAVLCLEAALAGLPVTGLALYEPPFVVSADRSPVGADYRERIQRSLALGRRGDAVAQFLTESAAMPAELVESMRSDPVWSALEQVAPTLASDAAIMGQAMSGDPAALRRYAPVAAPTLVISSRGSDPWLVAGTIAIADVLPNADHESLPGQHHEIPADVLVPVLSDWLPKLES